MIISFIIEYNSKPCDFNEEVVRSVKKRAKWSKAKKSGQEYNTRKDSEQLPSVIVPVHL